ncbi:MAG: DNA primase [Candidatus Cloacimonadota bacterium]|nr:MAG: DNA primase [Candidatus Cloacimonadota bacterium]PIE77687.1 MAG: DNA primase [Candidatus Delongbacteria bacterium]
MIPKEQIDKVLQTTNIVDIISERIDLRRAGANYKASCPFHDEKTASFMVSENKQIFKCFGCGISGNAIKFITEYDRIPWQDSVKLLAAKYGIDIVETNNYRKKDTDKITMLKDLYRDVAKIYFNTIQNSKSRELISFLEKRELDNNTINFFKIGYAPDFWNFLSDNKDLISKYGENFLFEAGFLKKGKSENYYDFFRNRVVFPIYDITGDVVAFSGRDLGDSDQVAKYLNSPETEIYNKSSIFFGFYHSLESIRKLDSAILVEGNLDQIKMFNFGYKNCIALCGTGLTEQHVKILKRNVSKVTIIFDGDKAGVKASLKSASLILDKGIEVRVVNLPEGEDPDSVLKAGGKEKMDLLIENSLSLLQFYNIKFGSFDSSEDKIRYLNSLDPFFSLLTNKLVKDLMLNEISELLNLNRSTIEGYLEKPFKRGSKRFKAEEDTKKVYSSGFGNDEVEFNLLYLMLSDNEILIKSLKLFDESYFSNIYSKKIFSIIYEQFEDGESTKFIDILSLIDDDGLKLFFQDYVSRQEEIYFSSSIEGKEKLLLAFSNISAKLEESKFLSKKDKVSNRLKFQEEMDEQLLRELYLLKKRVLK